MQLASEIRRRLKTILPQVLAVGVIGYFAYHAVQGERGFLAYLHLSQELAEAEAVAAAVASERRELSGKVDRLRDGSIDPDLLEERARALLNYGYAEETMVLRRSDRNIN
ncbi:FtsB family cell division protein [Algihabitans albus]|uniref:FtsB family cell division protein n=1 Tax=Algihabitans albus TaxID=2164067 RepID=UPI000E5C9A1E|nr:septum formation initiator family protein [Algihabitans albus]